MSTPHVPQQQQQQRSGREFGRFALYLRSADGTNVDLGTHDGRPRQLCETALAATDFRGWPSASFAFLRSGGYPATSGDGARVALANPAPEAVTRAFVATELVWASDPAIPGIVDTYELANDTGDRLVVLVINTLALLGGAPVSAEPLADRARAAATAPAPPSPVQANAALAAARPTRHRRGTTPAYWCANCEEEGKQTPARWWQISMPGFGFAPSTLCGNCRWRDDEREEYVPIPDDPAERATALAEGTRGWTAINAPLQPGPQGFWTTLPPRVQRQMDRQNRRRR